LVCTRVLAIVSKSTIGLYTRSSHRLQIDDWELTG